MDSLRSILVHLDAGRHAAARLALARTLAARHEARMTALFAVVPAVFGALPAPQATEARHRDTARALFDRSAAAGGWPMQWAEVTSERPVAEFAGRALHTDLLVLGQRDPHDERAFDLPVDFVEAVLTTSGKPAIVVPHHARAAFDGFGTILVAWHPGREAAAALTAALPLLQRAKEVHLVTWGDDAAALADLQERVCDHLRLHDVHGVQCRHGPLPAAPGPALLALAEGLGADLLVMGCYGHSRTRELALGGVSRSVLHEADLPLLMAH
ncbi:MAG: universal stress protein [Betaproteobacteria bacterium]